ncbi:MAG: DUF4832 domain-containing protein [Verrucomicrobiota bacterium]
MKPVLLTLALLLTSLPRSGADESGQAMIPIPLQSRIRQVQPMTGIVFWDDSENTKTDAIQLEFSYMRYSDIVTRRNTYNWSAVEKKLGQIAGRKHQAILRFYFVYPGRQTAVPAYIKGLTDYKETTGKSEGKDTGFPDWSHPELKRFVKEFYTRFAGRYDKDPRIAFLQTGFGLWAEYHIYEGPFKLGRTFPDKAFQAEFLNHLATAFKELPWSISVDAASEEVSPIADNAPLLKLPFGVFDDSFLCKQHAKENEPNWNALDRERYRRAPAGGEFSYYTDRDQKLALSPDGPHGVSFEKAARAFHISYMIGNDQPEHQTMQRIKQAGMACGYKFRIDGFQSGERSARVSVTNTGRAPIYRDAFVAVNGVRADRSLKGLGPGKSGTFDIASGGGRPRLTIESDHLVPGQVIGLEADLK